MISLLNRAFALLCVLGVLSVTAPAQARNRTNEMLRGEFSNFSDADLRRYSRWLEQDDVQVLPGITMSLGGFHASDGRRYQMLSLARIYNESAVPICVRARQQPGPGALSGRMAVDNTFKNLLIRPGQSETITGYASRTPVSGQANVQSALLIWSPNLAAPDGSLCSSRAPWFIGVWDRTPLGQMPLEIEPALLARLEGRSTASVARPSASYRASRELDSALRRRGTSIDPAGWTSTLSDLQIQQYGPLTLTAAAAASNGWMWGAVWIENSSNRPICIAGDGGLRFQGLTVAETSTFPPSGIYLAPGAARELQTIGGRFTATVPQPEFRPTVLAYDPPAGQTGDGACQAALPASALRQVRESGRSGSVGRISELFKR